jgi:adenine nucleotide transporter 17
MSSTGKPVNFLTSRTTFAHAVAGSAGSMLAMALCYPLDRVRTISQTTKKHDSALVILSRIIEEEGWGSLYRGLGPMLVALGTSNFVYFYWYTGLKAYISRWSAKQASSSSAGPLRDLVLASVAGTINVFLTTPFWVAATRLVVKGSKAASHTATSFGGPLEAVIREVARVGRNEGIPGLWSGLGASLMLVSNPSVQFAAYEKLKAALLRSKLGHDSIAAGAVLHMASDGDDATSCDGDADDAAALIEVQEKENRVAPITNIEFLLLGAGAKMVATLATYPLQVAQSRMRASANARKQGSDGKTTSEMKGDEETLPVYRGTMHCLLKIYKDEGMKGLYKGMDAKLLQTCLTSAFMFLFYERIARLIFQLVLWKKFKKTNID